MPGTTGRTIVHLIEPQHLFMQALVDVFAEAGLNADYVGPAIDPRRTLDDQPDLIFVDTDFVAKPHEAVRLLRALAPRADIVAYSSNAAASAKDDFKAAGATLVVDKRAERRAIVQALRDVQRRRAAGS